jgi:hypothetical protein
LKKGRLLSEFWQGNRLESDLLADFCDSGCEILFVSEPMNSFKLALTTDAKIYHLYSSGIVYDVVLANMSFFTNSIVLLFGNA